MTDYENYKKEEFLHENIKIALQKKNQIYKEITDLGISKVNIGQMDNIFAFQANKKEENPIVAPKKAPRKKINR